MRKKEQEITDRSKIEEVIHNSTICRLALSDNNIPYIVPVNFGYENNVIYIHSALEGRKIDIIHNNPNVCIEFDIKAEIVAADKACDWGIKYQSVIGFGNASIIKNKDDKLYALRILMKQYSDEVFAFSDDAVRRTAIIKVDLESITGKQSGY